MSPIFVLPKKDGTYRRILNLKGLNEHVEYHHFKMDTYGYAVRLVMPGCYMASVDLKDAYCSVPIAEEHQQFLKFQWKDKVFQYTCLPNWLASAPRMFTKLTKPVCATLRQCRHINMSYWRLTVNWHFC